MSPRTVTAVALLLIAMGSALVLNDAYSSSLPVSKPSSQTSADTYSTASHLAREERTIYFGFNQAALPKDNPISSDAREQLDELATIIGSDSRVKGARIIGYANDMGNAQYNERLSHKRADSVKNYLINKGVLNARVADTRWVGTQSPTTECSDNSARSELIDCLQQDRRVEIEIDYLPDLRASR